MSRQSPACDGKAPRIFAKLSRGGVSRNALYATNVIAGLAFNSMFGNQTVLSVAVEHLPV